MPQHKFFRWGLNQSDWKSTLILALLSSQILETSPRNAFYFLREIGESFPIQILEGESERDSKSNCSEKKDSKTHLSIGKTLEINSLLLHSSPIFLHNIPHGGHLNLHTVSDGELTVLWSGPVYFCRYKYNCYQCTHYSADSTEQKSLSVTSLHWKSGKKDFQGLCDTKVPHTWSLW